MTYYVAMDEGCYECGEPSACLGIFTSREPAERVCEEARELQQANWHGQHSFPVYEVPALNVATVPEYV